MSKFGVLVIFMTVFLTACDNAENIEPSSQLDKGSEDLGQSSTAIYLPSGGIDFGKSPIFDKVLEESSGKKYRQVIFEFKEPVEQVSEPIAETMISQGYLKRELSADTDYVVKHLFSKQGSGTVLIRYSKAAREGFTSLVVVTISWYL